jgi:plasmid stabilization system protein ParE
MNFEIVFSEKAQQEILQATQWYEEKQKGLGTRFSTILFSQLNVIRTNPIAYTERRKNYREAKVPQFPYLIVFRIGMKRKIILITSVFHTSRSAKSKYKRF